MISGLKSVLDHIVELQQNRGELQLMSLDVPLAICRAVLLTIAAKFGMNVATSSRLRSFTIAFRENLRWPGENEIEEMLDTN